MSRPLWLAPIFLLACDPTPRDSATDDTGEPVCAEGYQVYVGQERQPDCASECPEGSSQAYVDGDLLVCDACLDEDDCDSGQTCSAVCGAGCEGDAGGCCPVNVCAAAGG